MSEVDRCSVQRRRVSGDTTQDSTALERHRGGARGSTNGTMEPGPGAAYLSGPGDLSSFIRPLAGVPLNVLQVLLLLSGPLFAPPEVSCRKQIVLIDFNGLIVARARVTQLYTDVIEAGKLGILQPIYVLDQDLKLFH